MRLPTKNKDILAAAEDGEYDVLIHCQNIYHSWGKGFVVPLAAKYPEAKEADLATIKGDENKLGTYSKAVVTNAAGKEITILNCYCQKSYGQGKHFIEDEFIKVLSEIDRSYSGKTIAYPLIGAGRAGGDWAIISELINTSLLNVEHRLYKI